MDVLEVLDAAGKAIKKIRSGEGPYFLEIITYRYRGHSMGDPERYREAEEIQRWQEEDPIGIYHRQLIEKEIATEEELDSVIDQVEAEVEEAVQFAESSPDPEPDQLFVDIYADA
jgi:pyruvate dehydrogenase E1 component alpha subunit